MATNALQIDDLPHAHVFALCGLLTHAWPKRKQLRHLLLLQLDVVWHPHNLNSLESSVGLSNSSSKTIVMCTTLKKQQQGGRSCDLTFSVDIRFEHSQRRCTLPSQHVSVIDRWDKRCPFLNTTINSFRFMPFLHILRNCSRSWNQLQFRQQIADYVRTIVVLQKSANVRSQRIKHIWKTLT